MTSPAKVAANQRNAAKSTGPRSKAAKARTRYNAVRHGLAVPMAENFGTAEQIGELAMGLCGDSMIPGEQALAVRAAQAVVEMVRARRLRVSLVSRTAKHLAGREGQGLSEEECATLAFAKKSKILVAVDRYECRASATRNLALRRLQKLREAARRAKAVQAVGPKVPKQRPSNANPFEEWVLPLDVSRILKTALRAAPSNRYKFELPSLGWSIANVRGIIELQGDHGTLELSFDSSGERIIQTFKLARTLAHRGGCKWFVHCPQTQRLVRALYFMVGQRHFGSRHALGLTYESRRLSAAEAHRKRASKLLNRIGGPDEPGFDETLPPRPKHMHRETYDNICDDIYRHQLLELSAHLGWTSVFDDPDWPSLKHPRRKISDGVESREAEAARLSGLRQMKNDVYAEILSKYQSSTK
jgi:hypothetical protein